MRYLVGFLCVCGLGVVPVAGCFGPLFESGSCAGVVCPDDGNVCTDEHCRCDGWWCTPTCVSGPAVNGTECTFDGRDGVCVEGVCGENLCEGVTCDDDDLCTDDTCDYVDGTCDFYPVVCDDHNECTEDTCNPADGCSHKPVEGLTYCDNFGSLGSPPEICQNGACVPVPRDACTSAEDVAIICDPSFGDEVETCARDTVGPLERRENTALCLIGSTDVSADCAICYGAILGCMFGGECTAACTAGGFAVQKDGPEACPECGCESCLEWIGCDCTGDLPSACDPGGSMSDVGAFEVQP